MKRFTPLILFLVIGQFGFAQFTEHVLMSESLASTRPICSAFGDFDNDGDVDVASVSYMDDQVVWQENLGGGNYGGKQLVDTYVDAGFVRTGDIDNDGDIDIVVSSGGVGGTAWYENTGGGFSGNSNPVSFCDDQFELGDFDGDGDLDVYGQSGADGVWITENLGGGVFAPAIEVSTVPIGNMWLDIADVDGDGDLDLLNSSRNPGGTIRSVCWIENLGTSFGTTHIISNSSSIEYGEISAFDKDQDGDLDIICANVLNGNPLVFTNLGNGTFDTGLPFDNSPGEYRFIQDADPERRWDDGSCRSLSCISCEVRFH